MKKIFKNPILMFVLGLVIAGSIGVYATIKIQASEIGYKDGTVDSALNELYTNLDTKKILNSFGTPISATSQEKELNLEQ